MQLNIDFFSKDMIIALEGGIYQVEIEKGGQKKALYIGESVHPNIRCAQHLYNLKTDPSYFGFTSKSIEDSNILLIFTILESESDKLKRKAREKELIKLKTPISQSGISDRLSINRENTLNGWLNTVRY